MEAETSVDPMHATVIALESMDMVAVKFPCSRGTQCSGYYVGCVAVT